MEIAGLPLHPLLVHSAVVLGPLAALAALAWAAVARWQARLRGPMLALVVVAALSVLAAYLSGEALLEARPELGAKPLVGTHEERAEVLLWLTLALPPVAAVAAWGPVPAGVWRPVLRVSLALLALAVLVQVVLVGHAGARAVWGTA